MYLCRVNDTLPHKNTNGLRLHFRPRERRVPAIDSVIDKEEKAAEWLLKNHFEVDLAFAKAINRDDDALNWLEKNELQVFLILASKIRKYLDDKYLDYHKIHF